MICVECSAPIDSLYERYKGNHIRLTVCPNCQQVADKYIEYDRVLLSIDLMLLKPQAYKHTIYNQLTIDRRVERPCDNTHHQSGETTPASGVSRRSPSGNASKRQALSRCSTSSNSNSNSSSLAGNDAAPTGNNHFETYGYAIRLTILLLLFEVYIKWAYEEKNYFEGPADTSLVIQSVLKGPVQYLFFLTTTVLENIVLNLAVAWLIRKYLHFGEGELGSGREFGVISTTVLISNTIKLFPIVMLIWPYDNLILNVTRILVQCVHLAMLVEGLHIILLDNPYNQYWKIWLIVISAELLKFVSTKLIVDSVFSYWFGIPVRMLLADEMNQIGTKMNLVEQLVDKIGL